MTLLLILHLIFYTKTCTLTLPPINFSNEKVMVDGKFYEIKYEHNKMWIEESIKDYFPYHVPNPPKKEPPYNIFEQWGCFLSLVWLAGIFFPMLFLDFQTSLAVFITGLMAAVAIGALAEVLNKRR